MINEVTLVPGVKQRLVKFCVRASVNKLGETVFLFTLQHHCNLELPRFRQILSAYGQETLLLQYGCHKVDQVYEDHRGGGAKNRKASQSC